MRNGQPSLADLERTRDYGRAMRTPLHYFKWTLDAASVAATKPLRLSCGAGFVLVRGTDARLRQSSTRFRLLLEKDAPVANGVPIELNSILRVPLASFGLAYFEDGDLEPSDELSVYIADEAEYLPASQVAAGAGAAGASSANHGPVALSTVKAEIVAANPNREQLILSRAGANDIYLGASGVTAANGAHWTSGVEHFVFPRGFTGAVFGITGASTEDIRYFEAVR